MGRPFTAGPNPAPASLLRQGDRGADASGAALRPEATRWADFALRAPTGHPRAGARPAALAQLPFERSPQVAGPSEPARG